MNSADYSGQARELDLPGLPLDPLARYLRTNVPEIGDDDLHAELISGGRSNLTYLLSAGSDRWVLRRPPLGAVLATAHDMGREYRMLAALHPTPVPVPRPVHLASGPSAEAAIGAPFYVMEYVDGTVLRTTEQLRAVVDPVGLSDRMMRHLAALHELDAEALGLGALGRPDGYLERQLDRWIRQIAAIRSALLPDFTRFAERLASELPTTQRTALVHGDYRLDNMVVDSSGEILAVLDWEMATRGDPLADVASSLAWWDGMTGLDVPVATLPGGVPGFPDGHRLAATYAAATDLDLADLGWYVGFAFFKIAAIFEGIRHRADQGLTVGDGFNRLGPLVPELLRRGDDARR